MDNSLEANLSFWCKGISVTRPSKEFQMVLPKHSYKLGFLEGTISKTDWSEFLQTIYPLSDSDLANNYSLVLNRNDCLLIAADAMLDAHSRRSIAFCTISFSIDWSSRDYEYIASLISSAHYCLNKTLDTYIKEISNNHDMIEELIRKDKWHDREISLDLSKCLRLEHWKLLATEIGRFKGITGITTPRFATFGANVLLGTRHEVDIAMAKGHDISAYYDSFSKEIKPLNDTITTWPMPKLTANTNIVPKPIPGVVNVKSSNEQEQLNQVNQNLDDASIHLHSAVDSVFAAIKAGVRFWFFGKNQKK